MNIIVVSIDEPIYYFYFWKHVLSSLHGQICKIYIVSPLTKSWKTVIQNILYNTLLILTLYTIRDVFTVIKANLIAIFKLEKSPYSLFSLASYHKIPLQVIHTVNSEDFRDDIKQLSPDIILAQIPMLVRKESLDIPKFGWVNKHFGFLPDYKGSFPFLWAYWNREPNIGVSIHLMNEHYDEGPILGQEAVILNDDDTIPSVLKRLNETASVLMVECVKNISNAKPQINKQGRYFTKPTMIQLLKHLLFEWKRCILPQKPTRKM